MIDPERLLAEARLNWAGIVLAVLLAALLVAITTAPGAVCR